MEFLTHSLPWVTLFFFLFIAGLWEYKHKRKCKPLPPGPPGLPIIGHLHMLGDLPHRTLHKLSLKYGPIMQLRLGLVPTVVVSSSEAAELFLKTHDLNFASRPTTQASDYFSYGSKGIGFSAYGPYWRNIRKICTIHLLSNSKIESFMFLRKTEVGEFIKGLKVNSEDHEVVDISAKVSWVIERITYGMIFGRGYEEKFHFKPSIQELVQLYGVFNIADYIPFLKAFDFQGLTRRMKDVSRLMDTELEKIIQEHEQAIGSEREHRDFVDVLLSLMKSNEETLDRENIKAVTVDLLGASLDTSSTTIDWALTELLRNPEVMKHVQEELATVVGLHRMVEESDLPKLAYLNMVVKETMRLHPNVPFLLPRESIEDISIGGYHVPKKSRILINTWTLSRDPSNWPEKAEEFYPERFMNNDRDIRGNDFKYIPFGSGRRKCPGIELGLRTTHFVLAQLVHCFSFELPDGMSPGDIDMEEKFGLTIPRASPLLVVPSYRLHDESI